MSQQDGGGRTHRAFSISAADIAAESARVGGDLGKFDVSRVIKLDSNVLPPMGRKDLHVGVLAVAGEHNVGHAALADTVNIADIRGGKIWPGNTMVAKVTAVGDDVTRFKAGDIIISHCNGKPDIYGYPERIHAYDADNSVGWYGEEAVIGEWQAIRAPLDCGLSLWEIAALPLRAPTAYHLWRRAEGIFRVKVPVEKRARLNVLGFGGGVSELLCMLAKSHGHNAFYCSGTPERRAALKAMGIIPIDQKQFNRFASGDDVKAFSKLVKKLTDGEGMHIVCDMLRGPVFQAGVVASARLGVNVSAGWQLSRECNYNSANLSVRQVTLDHTHYETIDGCHAATELYGSVFTPTIHSEIYRFEHLPRALHELHKGIQTGIPIIRVAQEMPESVQRILGFPS